MSSTSDCPWLLNELVQQIISEVWHSDLSADHRVTFMTASLLVNKSFQRAFLHVSSIDPYIPCPSYCCQLHRILCEQCPIYDENTKHLPDICCRSLTIQSDSCTLETFPEIIDGMGSSITSPVYIFFTSGALDKALPNLRNVSLQFHNCSYNNLFDSYEVLVLPDQVTGLNIRYTFAPPFWTDGLQTEYERHHLQRQKLKIRNLTVTNAPAEYVSDVVEFFPNLETLATDAAILDHVIADNTHPLPASLHTLTLKVDSAEEMKHLRIAQALDSGLFSYPSTTPRRIVIESVPTDQKALDHLKGQCEGRGVQFIHLVR